MGPASLKQLDCIARDMEATVAAFQSVAESSPRTDGEDGSQKRGPESSDKEGQEQKRRRFRPQATQRKSGMEGGKRDRVAPHTPSLAKKRRGRERKLAKETRASAPSAAQTGTVRVEQGRDPKAESATVTIEAPPKVYRPKPPSTYREPDLGEGLLDGVWVHRDLRRLLKEETKELPPRDDVISFDIGQDGDELKRNLELSGCPPELHTKIRQLVREYWDVFSEGGLRKPIRGFSFQVDTGDSPPRVLQTPAVRPARIEGHPQTCPQA